MTMNVKQIIIDTEVMGRSVLALRDISPDDNIASEEILYLAAYNPGYVYCQVPVENLLVIHNLEACGFRLIEVQIKSVVNFQQDHDVSRYPYEYQKVTTKEALNDVLNIAGETVVHDRLTVDPDMPVGISGERYRRYVQKSYDDVNEEVWRLYDPSSKTTLAFRTHRKVCPGEVLLLLGGVHPDFKNLGLGVVSSYFCFNQMRRDGIKKAMTHISAINYPIMNLEIGFLGFRALNTFAVMRKIYA